VRNQLRHKYLAPRRLVGSELASAKVGSIEIGALAMAYTLKRRIENSTKRAQRTVLLDIDGTVYAAMTECTSIDRILVEAPHIVVGSYKGTVDAAALAADLEMMRRAA
jgi:hypothetical protein